MPTLLRIDSSPRGDYSISRALTARFTETWKQKHPDGKVVTRDLMKTDLPFVDLPWIAGAYSPAEQHTPEMKEALAISNELIAELKAADHIVIGAPMYNFSTPAVLKAYIDHIVRINETFSSSYQGLVTGKKLTILQAAGSDYGPGSPMESMNVEIPYLKQVFGFIGITDVDFVSAGGAGAVERGQADRGEFIAKNELKVEALVK